MKLNVLLKKTRIYLKITSKEVSKKTDISIKTLYNWESGKTKIMNIDKLIKLCGFYTCLLKKA
jgi:transcriptional regulator with XRE-family HTH domain